MNSSDTLLEKNILSKKVSKGTILQRKGDQIIRAFYVTKGLLRSYYIDVNGKEHILMFAPENWLVTDVSLFGNPSEANLYIDALEDSEILIINAKVFEETQQLSNEILADQIKKLINRINTLQKRILLLMTATAEERYLDFLENYPEIVQRVSQKMIASYLKITPEVLSKVKKQLAYR